LGIISIFSGDYSAEIIVIMLGAWLIAITIAIVFHECAHAWVANKMGDPTAKYAGRVTLNPAKHIDWIGALCLLIFGFGWAKPVPVNPVLYKNYRKGQVLVSLAGVTVNFILGIILTFLSVISLVYFDSSVLILNFLQYLFFYTAIINYVLAVLNLLPIYPLDGFSLLEAFVSPNNKFMRFMRQYGMFILLILLISTALDYVFDFIIEICYYDLRYLFLMMFA